VATPNKRTIREVCQFLGASEDSSAKLLIYLADGKPVAALVRGDHELNESKFRRAIGATALAPADPATIEKATGAPMGFLGPVAIKIPLVIDRAITDMASVVVGGNERDVHFTGVVPGRDFPLERVADIRNAGDGDRCPRCGNALKIASGLEVGHVFKLGTKYSKSMGATYLDEKGNEVMVVMGCYGIGINRIIAGAIEASHDANGIIWPLAIAPYQVLLVPLPGKDSAVTDLTAALEAGLAAAGLDVLIDDRDQRPGFKFKDADLIGIPLRVVIGDRGLKEGKIELKWRDHAEPQQVTAATAIDTIVAEIAGARQQHAASCAEKVRQRASARRSP
jgi:prolyl-tRNA synthetase